MNYEFADRALKDMNRRNLRAFDRLKLLKFDEMNVLRSVTKVYRDSVKLAKKRYLEIAWEAYCDALILAGIDKKRAERMADESITEDWILDMLEEYDPVTLYQFTAEAERKAQRTAEAILASGKKTEEVEKALRLWTRQVGQYCITAVDKATVEAFEEAGIDRVKWITERDNRVCEICHGLDGMIFPIKKVPSKPHINCRCTLEIVKGGNS